jgi:subtilisin family serine protease
MSQTRLLQILSLCFCCTITSTSLAQQPDNISKKTAGNLSKVLRASPTPSPDPATLTTASANDDSATGPEMKQKELVPLKFIFRTRAGATFPDNFRRFVPAEAQATGTGLVGTQVFSLSLASDEPLRAGVEVQDVITIEIERPLVPGPFMEVSPRNLGARRSHHVEEFNAEFPNLNGENVTGAVVDGGSVLSTHFEFRLSPQNAAPNRVQVNTSARSAEHATHVAGTMAAAGRRREAKGMAPSMNLISDDWDDDLRKLATLAPSIQVSNHSYGPLAGWHKDQQGRWRWWGDRVLSRDEDAKFGKYSSREAQLDEVLFQFPHLLTFIAAGNDRDDGPDEGTQPLQHLVIDGTLWVTSSEIHRRDGFEDGGLDTIAGLGLAKNAVCIGAVDDITTTSGINMISYSGWGPTDDGRIKPDLVANGHHLLSTSNAGDSEYVDMSGTSMASPTASGIAGLLVQLYQRERGTRPTAAELKAVMIHTATDAGERGPDPVFGWGSIEALRAGRVIAQHLDAQNFRHILRMDQVKPGETKEYKMTLNGTNDPIKVTVVWTDPAGEANMGGLDDATPVLVNDLDLKLVSPDGQEFFPYSLDRANPKQQARRDRPNGVDNVEVIERVGPLAGEWKVRVTGTRISKGPNQPFALVVSGLRPM